MLKTLISVSTHPAKNQINKYARDFEKAGADFFHCDVMDGVFVEDKAFNIEMLKQLKNQTTLPLDVHLMVKNPQVLAPVYCEKGANIVTIHKENFNNEKQLLNCLKSIKSNKVLAGVSIKPKTPISEIHNILKYVDLVLVMSVEPGASGQKFLNQSLEKISQLNQIRKKSHLNFLIEVDGGVNADNCKDIINAGADILVSGSYIYNSPNYTHAINNLKVNN